LSTSASVQRLAAVPTKRGPVRPVDYLEADEIRAMLDVVTRYARNPIRDRALLLTLFNTGARVQELLDIQASDLHLERPTFVRLRGKGRKERLCPLWPETVEALRILPGVAPGSSMPESNAVDSSPRRKTPRQSLACGCPPVDVGASARPPVVASRA